MFQYEITYYIIAIILGVLLLWILFCIIAHNRRHQKYLNSTLSDLDHLTGEEFENYLQEIFIELGYSAKTTPKSHDYGADLIINKHDIKTVVQAKRYKGNVGIAAIQQIIGAKAFYKADECMVVTNQYFTASAKKLAQANRVKLMDRNDLYKISKK